MRSDRFTELKDIEKKYIPISTDPSSGGPVIYSANGKNYIDRSESHIMVLGNTGMGKTQCCSLPFVRNSVIANESFIVIDPKGEIYEKTSCFAEKSHRVFCLDFRKPRKSPIRWNPLQLITELYLSDDKDEQDQASSFLDDFAESIQKYDKDDQFWASASAELFKGMVYSLLELCNNKEKINMSSVCAMLQDFNEKIGASTYAKELVKRLPDDSLAKRHLLTFVNSPTDTRNSIYAVCANSFKIFSQSKGLMSMIGHDDLDIYNLDLDNEPLAVYIILPDETNAYDSLAAVLISQLTTHFITLAQTKYNGKLPSRLNVILEEIGSLGGALTNLPNLLSAGRSRNIRLMLLLQSTSQLEDIYGKSKAETINSCIGITIGFSTNSWSTLKEWEDRLGTRSVEQLNGTFALEPVITASQLAAMPRFTALIMIGAQYKYITNFALYDQMYDNSEWEPPAKCEIKDARENISKFSLIAYIKRLKAMEREKLFGNQNPFESNDEDLSIKDDELKRILEELSD
ncbi:MAG: type IV secretory system conjugative DNA transfer family protein [Clostridiales bacterium]|nr:type IV secretory system conjugative DNA transfer family protein [Clostridiales bacterium]